ncbi:MAG: hypothetical protein ACRCW2_06995 [Cellulosilyticaceae bacterium]
MSIHAVPHYKEQSGLHFQLDSGVIGKETARFRGELSKIDGGIFEEGLDAYEFDFRKEGSSRGSASLEKRLSEDQKTIYVVLEMDYESLHELKNVTLSVERVGDEGGNLFEINTPHVQNYKTQSIKVNQQLTVGKNEMWIKELVFDPLHVTIKGKQGKTGEKLALLESGSVVLQMVDGERIALRAGDMDSLYDEIFEYKFEPTQKHRVDGIEMPMVLEPDMVTALVVKGQSIPIGN